jgi:F-type H+-transporting ATPase subunit epsilon
MATIQVDIVSAEGEIYAGEASMVFAPAAMGEVGIAPRHAPMLTMLKPGEIRVQDADGNEEAFYITGGMLEVQPNLVTVLADTALRGDQLDEAAALSAQQEAEKALEGASEETDVARALPRSSRAKARTHAVCNAKRPPKGRPFLWCQSPHSCLIHPPGTALSPAGFRI